METDIIKKVARRAAAEFKGTGEVIDLIEKNKSNPRVVIDDCFAESNKVVMRFRAFFPLEDDGEVIRNEIVTLWFEGEKIAEWWAAFDRQTEIEQGGGIEF